MTNAPLDFGYPWWLSYGHLVVLAPAAALLLLGYRAEMAQVADDPAGRSRALVAAADFW